MERAALRHTGLQNLLKTEDEARILRKILQQSTLHTKTQDIVSSPQIVRRI